MKLLLFLLKLLLWHLFKISLFSCNALKSSYYNRKKGNTLFLADESPNGRFTAFRGVPGLDPEYSLTFSGSTHTLKWDGTHCSYCIDGVEKAKSFCSNYQYFVYKGILLRNSLDDGDGLFSYVGEFFGYDIIHYVDLQKMIHKGAYFNRAVVLDDSVEGEFLVMGRMNFVENINKVIVGLVTLFFISDYEGPRDFKNKALLERIKISVYCFVGLGVIVNLLSVFLNFEGSPRYRVNMYRFFRCFKYLEYENCILSHDRFCVETNGRPLFCRENDSYYSLEDWTGEIESTFNSFPVKESIKVKINRCTVTIQVKNPINDDFSNLALTRMNDVALELEITSDSFFIGKKACLSAVLPVGSFHSLYLAVEEMGSKDTIHKYFNVSGGAEGGVYRHCSSFSDLLKSLSLGNKRLVKNRVGMDCWVLKSLIDLSETLISHNIKFFNGTDKVHLANEVRLSRISYTPKGVKCSHWKKYCLDVDFILESFGITRRRPVDKKFNKTAWLEGFLESRKAIVSHSDIKSNLVDEFIISQSEECVENILEVSTQENEPDLPLVTHDNFKLDESSFFNRIKAHNQHLMQLESDLSKRRADICLEFKQHFECLRLEAKIKAGKLKMESVCSEIEREISEFNISKNGDKKEMPNIRKRISALKKLNEDRSIAIAFDENRVKRERAKPGYLSAPASCIEELEKIDASVNYLRRGPGLVWVREDQFQSQINESFLADKDINSSEGSKHETLSKTLRYAAKQGIYFSPSASAKVQSLIVLNKQGKMKNKIKASLNFLDKQKSVCTEMVVWSEQVQSSTEMNLQNFLNEMNGLVKEIDESREVHNEKIKDLGKSMETDKKSLFETINCLSDETALSTRFVESFNMDLIRALSKKGVLSGKKASKKRVNRKGGKKVNRRGEPEGEINKLGESSFSGRNFKFLINKMNKGPIYREIEIKRLLYSFIITGKIHLPASFYLEGRGGEGWKMGKLLKKSIRSVFNTGGL